MKIYLFIILFLPFYALCQTETRPEAGGPPTKQELVGFWKMIELPNKAELNKVNPWPLPYQWFGFYDNGKVYSMMNSKDDVLTPADLGDIFKIFSPASTPNYKLDGQFITIDNPDVKDYLEVWGINILGKDVGSVAKKGDIVMTLDDGKGNVVYYRLLRRIK